ncbi:hypothetical protein GT037_003206 [Alternaria burnsii]|uniref:VOC domain-containing protein n=1 Tax=Alternaria burnsii TaxID=1187904 RepID=A0A8H7BHA9_9PLEO|nr:uncharacterized protein GT037_003206 [Alternaria burnsii]KAF7679458.1 hypothetical protein GT037_003206 [Alternaria burnsii]
MLDHIGITVPTSRFEEVTAWYLTALAPLGYSKHKEFHNRSVGLGPDRSNIVFFITAKEDTEAAATHVAFRCTDRKTVEKFHEEAVKAGGKDNGKPGWRHQYHAKYYAAFVMDPVGMPMMPTSDRLQVLLDSAREANKIEPNRVSLETFLAGLHEEDKSLDELAIYETLLRVFDATTSVSQATQTSALTASCAVQTDAATISLWDLLPKARKEAYDRGFHAGKDYGYVQGIKEGRSTGITEGLAVGFEQGQAEGLNMGLVQGKEVGTQHSIGIGKKVGYAEDLAQGLGQAEEEIKKSVDKSTQKHMLQMEMTREKIVVKLPPTLTTTISKKKDSKKANTESNGVDPFASLLCLVHKK